MLILHVQHLHSEYLPTLFVDALAHYPMSALPYLLLHSKALLERILPQAELQLPRLSLVQGVMCSHFHVVALVLSGTSEIVNCLILLHQSCS